MIIVCYLFIIWIYFIINLCFCCIILPLSSYILFKCRCQKYCLKLRKEGNVLFNDTLNTFYLRLYCVRHIAWKETCYHHMGYFFWLAASLLYLHHPRDRIAHTRAFVTPVVAHWLEREIAQWVYHEGSIQWPIANALTMELHLTPIWNYSYLYNVL